MLRLSNKISGDVEIFELALSSALAIDNEIDSLWFRVRFSDAEAKKEAFRHDVSINLVKELVDGTGNTYKPAANHIALTTSPVIPGLGPWVPDPHDPLVATKEVIYTGDFYKKIDNLHLSVNQKYFDKLIANTELMLSNGVPLPLQLGHDGDTNGRGKVLGFFKAKRPEIKSLGLANIAKFNPQRQFLALALSANTTFKAADTMNMTLDELVALCGLTLPPDADDAAKIAAVKEWFGKATAAMAAAGAPNAEEEKPLSQTPAAPAAPVAPAGPSLANALDPRKVSMTVSLSSVQSVKQVGQTLLDQLVMGGRITPAKAKALADNYNTDSELQVSLSSGSTQTPLMRALAVELADNAGGWQQNGRTNVPAAVASASLSGLPGFQGQSRVSALAQDLERRGIGQRR